MLNELNRTARSNLDRDVHARGEIELLQLVHGFSGWFDNIQQALVRPLLKGFLRLFVRVRRAQQSKALDASWKGNWACDTRARAFHGIGDVAGGLVYDSMVKGLKANTNALS